MENRYSKTVKSDPDEETTQTIQQIRDIIEHLDCILTAHDSCAELIDYKDHKAFVYCGGPCKSCDNRCIEDAIKQKLPHVEVVIQ
jgi:hypothetical protein